MMIVPIKSISKKTKANVFGLLGSTDLTGSIKDRPAKLMVLDLVKKGVPKGTTVVEGTAGNTGLSLAYYCQKFGYEFVAVVPDKMSKDKIDKLKDVCKEVHVVKTLPKDHPNNYIRICEDLAKQAKGIYIDQFNNAKNSESHMTITGPEIDEYFKGQLDFVFCGIGTGGTFSGITEYLKNKKGYKTKFVVGEPQNSYIGQLKEFGEIRNEIKFSIEGIGGDYVPPLVSILDIDFCIQVPDVEAYETCQRFLFDENVAVGGSSGVQLAAFEKFSSVNNLVGKNVLILLPDHGLNYLSKVF